LRADALEAAPEDGQRYTKDQDDEAAVQDPQGQREGEPGGRGEDAEDQRQGGLGRLSRAERPAVTARQPGRSQAIAPTLAPPTANRNR
jgi:hypothetical protein